MMRRSPRYLRRVLAVLSTLVLATSCGGDSSGGTTNRPPSADAGSDRSVAVGQTVTLDASGSSDPDGDVLTFTWSLDAAPVGTSAKLSQPGGARTELTPDMPGTYEVTLTATDGSASDSVTVEIEVAAPPPNRAPQADAGPDQNVPVGTQVTLDATGSSDPDGDDLDYAWRFVTSPGSAPSLTGDEGPTPSFTPPEAGDYTLELTVSDGDEDANDRVTIDARASAPATTVHVSVDGDDGNPGTADAPVATLQRALAVAEAEDLAQIRLADGRYDAEPYGYTIDRRVLIEGESRDGAILDAGSADVLNVEAPSDADEPVKVFVQDLTIDTTGRGLHLRSTETEGYLTRVSCLDADPCASTGDSALILPVPGGRLTVRNSSAVGSGSGSAFLVIGRQHLLQGTTVRGYAAGLETLAAGFLVRDATFENNDVGIDALLASEDGTPLRVRNTTLASNGVGVQVGQDASVDLANSTITDNDAHGVRFDSSGEPDGILTDVTVTGNGASGVRADGVAEVEVIGGTFTENGQASNPDDFVDQAGIYAGGASSLLVRASSANGPASFARNDQDNLAVVGNASATLIDVQAEEVDGPGAGVYASTSNTVNVRGGRYTGHANGFYVTGGTDLTLEDVRAADNRNNGLSYGATGQVYVRDSEFRNNGASNVLIRNEPAKLDFGTPGDPGGNVLERAADTEWSLSDERPDRSGPDGVLLQAADMTFGEVGGWSGRHTGPLTSTVGDFWRITGTHQRIDFH